MAIKRNRWLVVSVLVVAVGAFLAISLLPLLSGWNDRSAVTAPARQDLESADIQAELVATARGYGQVLRREPDNQIAFEGFVEAIRELVELQIQLNSNVQSNDIEDNDIETVVELLEELAELKPDFPRFQVLLGQTKQQLGDFDGAAQAYRTVLNSNPGEIIALQALVALLIQQNRPQTAIDLLQDTLQMAPQANNTNPGAIDVTSVQFLLAQVYIQQNRPQAAIGLLQDALQTASQVNSINPGTIDVASVQLLLAQVYVEEEQIDEALRIYDEAIANTDDDFRPFLAKALVLREQGDIAEADDLFEKAEEMAPVQYKDQVRQLAAEPAATETPVSDGEDSSLSSGESESSDESVPAEPTIAEPAIEESSTDAGQSPEAEGDGPENEDDDFTN